MQPQPNFQHPNPMPSQKQMSETLTVGERLNATNADFLLIDVETALTFSKMALETNDEAKKHRNRINARKAYDTILRHWNRVTFSPGDEVHMHEMMSHLKHDLAMLGENL